MTFFRHVEFERLDPDPDASPWVTYPLEVIEGPLTIITHSFEYLGADLYHVTRVTRPDGTGEALFRNARGMRF